MWPRGPTQEIPGSKVVPVNSMGPSHSHTLSMCFAAAGGGILSWFGLLGFGLQKPKPHLSSPGQSQGQPGTRDPGAVSLNRNTGRTAKSHITWKKVLESCQEPSVFSLPPPSRSLSLARSPIPLSHVEGRRWPLHGHKSHRSVRTTSKAGCCLPSHFLRVSSWAKSRQDLA